MFKPLIKFFTNAQGEDIANATLEDMLILTTLRASYDQAEIPKELDFIPELVDQWLDAPRDNATGAETDGLQILLSELLDKLALDGINALNRSELDTLIATHELIQRTGIPDEYDSTERMLASHANALTDHSKKLDPDPGLTGLEGTILYTTAKTLETAPIRDIGNFAGLNLPARGPVFTYHGNVKVLDFVPDRCMLVVDGGSCAVNGYVLGRIACSANCTVRGNVGGVMVTNRGDIRAHKILDRAYIVAKWGSVRAIIASDPELVYGGESITIEQSTRFGTYASPTIKVGGKVDSGDFTISKSLHAQKYSSSPQRELTIELATKVTSDIYGGLVDPDVARMLNRLARLRQKILTQTNLLELADKECEHYADAAVYYFLGNDEKEHQFEELHKKRRRLSFLERVIVGIELLSRSSEQRLERRERSARASSTGQPHPEEDEGNLLDELDDNNDNDDLPADEDLAKEKEHLQAMSKKMRSAGSVTPTILIGLRERRASWIRERNILLRQIAHMETDLKDMSASAKAMTQQNEGLSRLQLLSQLLTMVQTRPRTDRFRVRAGSPFLQLMLKSIKTRRQRARSSDTDLEEMKTQYEQQSTNLMNMHRIPAPPLDSKDASHAQTTGIFTSGVIICTERFLLEENDPPAHSVVRTRADGNSKTYQREENVIIEVECATQKV